MYLKTIHCTFLVFKAKQSDCLVCSHFLDRLGFKSRVSLQDRV